MLDITGHIVYHLLTPVSQCGGKHLAYAFQELEDLLLLQKIQGAQPDHSPRPRRD
jgi:hypothetical protein